MGADEIVEQQRVEDVVELILATPVKIANQQVPPGAWGVPVAVEFSLAPRGGQPVGHRNLEQRCPMGTLMAAVELTGPQLVDLRGPPEFTGQSSSPQTVRGGSACRWSILSAPLGPEVPGHGAIIGEEAEVGRWPDGGQSRRWN